MILKTLTHDHGSSDCWNYYDGIDSASVFFHEGSGMSCLEVHFKETGETITIALTDVAYLCNDNGNTIEKLRPAVKEMNSTKPLEPIQSE